MKLKGTLNLVLLMIAGEAAFLLPFVVARIFRPTFLAVFDITNLQLGTAFSVYGVIAMIAYFAGGPIADRYSPRKLMFVALGFTAIGGFSMALIPSLLGLTLLYGFWGVSTILLFWAAFVKATRALGGENSQGKSFGLVDGGRGFVAAILASVSVLLFDAFLPVNAETASIAEMSTALGYIIYIFCGIIIIVALLIWFTFPDGPKNETISLPKLSLEGVEKGIKNKMVWLQGIILLCAYVGYKCTDDFSLYASDVLGYNDVNAAHIGTISFWVRPFAAIAAGFLGDRFQISKLTIVCFIIIILGSFLIGSGLLIGSVEALLILTIATTSAGIYGLRGLYYALFQESNIPLLYTGSAAGVISVIGYTPDIFMGPLMGYVLDASPGVVGHQHLFGILMGFAVVGLLMTFLFRRSNSNK
jgi:MFS family permease